MLTPICAFAPVPNCVIAELCTLVAVVNKGSVLAVPPVVVTLDAQLSSWADRVVFLRDGRVVDQTAPLPGPESLLMPGQTP